MRSATELRAPDDWERETISSYRHWSLVKAE